MKFGEIVNASIHRVAEAVPDGGVIHVVDRSSHFRTDCDLGVVGQVHRLRGSKHAVLINGFYCHHDQTSGHKLSRYDANLEPILIARRCGLATVGMMIQTTGETSITLTIPVAPNHRA